MTDYLERVTENQEEEMESVNRLEENRFKCRTTHVAVHCVLKVIFRGLLLLCLK